MDDFLFSLGCYEGEPITVISHIKGGCVVSIKDGRYTIDKALAEAMATKNAPKWLETNKENLSAKVVAMPERDDIDFPFNEQLIVELYSK